MRFGIFTGCDWASTKQGWFRNAVSVLHYVRLGQVRLRRSNDPQSVPTILRPFGQLIGIVKKYSFVVFYYVRLGQVRLRRALRSAIGPYYPQAIRSIDQGWFQNMLLVLPYVRLGQVRLRRSYDPQLVPTILRLFGPLIRVGFKIYYWYSTMLGQVRLG